jgi:hypothetical protein
MKTKLTITQWLTVLAFSVLSLSTSTVFAQGTTAFTYQGQLHDSGTNANGAYTMVFALYDAASGGNQIGGAITTNPTLVNGLFTVNLDFGAGAFNGNACWLDITVQSGSDSEELTPRVQVLSSPYALYAETAANLSGGTWNATIGNYKSYSNVFGIFNGGSLMLGMSTNGAKMNMDLDVNGGISASSLGFDGGGSISGDGHGGLNFNGTIGMLSAGNISASGNITANGGFGVGGANGSWLAQIDSGGNISASGNVNVNNLTVTSGTLALGSYPAWSLIYSDGNGGLSIGGTAIDPDGIATTGEINVNNGTAIISPNGDIQANWFNGLGVNASIGVNCEYIYVDEFIDAGGGISCESLDASGDVNADNVYANNLVYKTDEGGDGGGDDEIAAKSSVTSTNGQDILNRVTGLSLSTWSSKRDPNTHHVGPKARDFQAAFGLGQDGKTISLVDESGVALAAIQGLNEKLKEKGAQIEALNKRLADLEQQVKTSAQK